MFQVSDFGLSHWNEYKTTSANNVAGTASHIPPEYWKNPSVRRNEMFDIYSFGILMWELFVNEPPYDKRLLPGMYT